MTVGNELFGRAASSRRGALVQAASVLALGAALSGAAASQALAQAASAGGAVDQVVVTASRWNTIEGAISEKKNDISVTSVVSAEEIAQRPAGNIVDVLSHVPGLSGYSDMGLGQAATGERQYVTIRGIDSSYNAYTLNGIRVPQADPGSRALSLRMFPPFGLQAVKVVKTPTSDMQGDAIGGIIDIRTPTAFDFTGPMTRIHAEGAWAGLADKLGGKAGGGTVQGEIARRFGPGGAFGVYFTAYYDQKNSMGEAIEIGGYVPTLAAENGKVTDFSKANGLSATSVRYDGYQNKIQRYGGNFSLDWRTPRQSLYLQASYGHYEVTGDDVQRSISTGATSFYSNGTTFSPVGVRPGAYYQERDQTEQTGTLKLGGATNLDRLSLEYEVSAGYAENARPDYVEGSLYGPTDPGSALIDFSDPTKNGLTFGSPATAAYILGLDTVRLWKVQGSDSASTNAVYGAKFDAAYKVDGGWLDMLRGGLDINVSKRDQYQHQFFGANGGNFAIVRADGVIPPFTDSAGPAAGAIPGRNLPSFMDGTFPGTFRIFDRSVFQALAVPNKYMDHFGLDPVTGLVRGNPGAYTVNDYMRNSVHGTESIYAGYGEANLRFGDLQAIAGARYEYTDFDADVWQVDGAKGGFQNVANTYGQLLPSLNLVYRPSSPFVLRGAVRKSFARPAYGLIARSESVARNTLTDEIVSISRSNPDLKAAEAVNYDASIEYYGVKGTILEANVYHKDIDNFIYAAASAGGYPSANTESAPVGGVIISRPENGKSANLTGFEFNVRHTFAELPGAWSGLGVGVSATLQRSSADSGRPDHFGRKTWLPRAPRTMYNLDLFYNKYGVRANVSYQYTGLQLNGLTGNNLDTYLQPVKSVDLSLSYAFRKMVVSFAVKNLTDNVLFYKTLGKTTQYLGTQEGGGNGSYVETGRFFTLGVAYAW